MDAKYLPSALNLYADRLSRQRRYFDYLPQGADTRPIGSG